MLNEYAVVYFSLLNEAYRQENEQLLVQANLILLPYYRDEDRAKFLNQLKWASQDPSDILKPSDSGTDVAQLKKFFSQRM